MLTTINFDDIDKQVSDLFLQNVKSCKYCEEPNLSKLDVASDSLFVIYINIRSIQKKFDNLCELLSHFDRQPDLICIAETRLKGNPITNINKQNYDFFT